jgi:Flp pilus assembly protein TadG
MEHGVFVATRLQQKVYTIFMLSVIYGFQSIKISAPLTFVRAIKNQCVCVIVIGGGDENRTGVTFGNAPMLITKLLRFARGREGNVAITFAFASIPTIFLLGMGLDYSSAVRRQSQLDAATDAAALAAVTPAMMAQDTQVATAAATNVFNAKAVGLGGLQSTPTPTITVTNNGLVRTVTVAYTAQATNNFPLLLGTPYWTISGTSTASSTVMPNINFYLLLDASPSMAIAGTPTDITTMVNHTSSQGGCAFACHESNPSADSLGNPGGEDNYALARSLGVTLRIDLMAQATASLMSTAKATETASNNTYKMALYTFDSAIHALQGTPTSNLTLAASDASAIQVLEVVSNNPGCQTASLCNDDTDTDFDNAMSIVNTNMPNPGGGTNVQGDTPQEVLFIVSDGVDDKTSSTCSQSTISYSGGIRCQQPFDTTWCTTVKNRGIRIAVLYTEYLPLPTNSWYETGYGTFKGIAPFQPQIATNMQACASSGLYFEVQSGGDISSAMAALFQQAVATARLTQ